MADRANWLMNFFCGNCLQRKLLTSCCLNAKRPNNTQGYSSNSNALERQFPITTSELAALSMEHDLVLITRDQHFEKIAQLQRA